MVEYLPLCSAILVLKGHHWGGFSRNQMHWIVFKFFSPWIFCPRFQMIFSHEHSLAHASTDFFLFSFYLPWKKYSRLAYHLHSTCTALVKHLHSTCKALQYNSSFKTHQSCGFLIILCIQGLLAGVKFPRGFQKYHDWSGTHNGYRIYQLVSKDRLRLVI